MKLTTSVFAVVLTLSLSLPSQTANAKEGAGFVLAITGVGLAMAGGVAGLTGNSIYLADEERPPLGWRATGYTLGSIMTLSGAVMTGLWAPNIESEAALVGMSSGVLALGVAQLVVTILADMQPEAPPESEGEPARGASPSPSIGIAPLIIPREGAPTTYGLSLSVNQFWPRPSP